MLRAAAFSLALFATPAFANSYYHAQPDAAPAQARVLARDNVWRCGEAGCTSARGPSRPAIVCATLAREVGRLSSFTANGRTFAAEELESCNSRAR